MNTEQKPTPSSAAPSPSPASAPSKMPWMIAGAIIVALVIVGVVLSSNKNSRPMEEEQMGDENEGDVLTSSSTKPMAFTVEGKTYAFSGVEWNFTTAQVAGVPKTTVRMQVTDLTRNGVAITLLPYRLGTYTGTCTELNELDPQAYDREADGMPLAAAQCWFNGAGTQHIIFQNDKLITAKIRMISEEDESYPPLTQITQVDIASVVK